MNKPKIAIIGASELQLPLVLKAKEKGYETHVFAWEEGAIAKDEADYFYPISIVEKEEILKICLALNIEGIVSIASDLAVLTVNYVARHLGLVCNPEITDTISTNKFLMRQAFAKNNVPIPWFQIVDETFDFSNINGLTYPLIVKATDRSGSRGISKVNNKKELIEAIEYAKNVSFEKKALIEEFVEGDEYSCESISYNGIHHCLAITKKYTTGHPHFIEVAHLEPAPFCKEKQNYIFQEVKKALDSLSIKYGASHAEFKIDQYGNIKFIEIGSRMGGDCIGSHLVHISTGYDFVGMVIDIACGKEPDFTQNKIAKYAVTRYVTDSKSFDLLNKAKQELSDRIVYMKDVAYLPSTDVIDSSSRYGMFVLALDDIDDVKCYLPNELK
jgi:biotin carboxylase